jgi:multisubunit Na+/H+ antiporter MnhB subunit
MKRNIRNLTFTLGQLDSRYVRLGLVVFSLAVFVLGAGAPGIGGH